MSWLIISLLIALGVLNGYTIVQAVMRAHGVEGAWAWVFAILALPGLGAVAYLILGSPSIRRTTRRKRRTRHAVRRAMAAGGEPNRATPPQLPEPVDSLLELATRLTELSPTSGNQVQLLSNDARAFKAMEQAISRAQRFIWAEYYLIRNDETGLRFLDLLIDRARAGVEVRLLYDAVGSLGLDRQRLATLHAAGGLTEEFLPLNPLRRRWAVQLRNHRKIVVVDGQIGFTGGMNVGDEYSGRARRRGAAHFRDSLLALSGPVVDDLAQTFAEDWLFATDESLVPPAEATQVAGATSVVAVIPSGPDQELNASSMVFFAGIATARRQIWLASPYFIPDPPTMRALQAAALRGVDVRIMVPAVSDVPLVNLAARSYFPLLVRSGVRVFEYQPSILHSKTMLVDKAWGIVGSANLDFRSFRLNFELSALVVDPAFAEEMARRFSRDLARSTELTDQMLARDGRLARFRYRLARLLSPLL